MPSCIADRPAWVKRSDEVIASVHMHKCNTGRTDTWAPEPTCHVRWEMMDDLRHEPPRWGAPGRASTPGRYLQSSEATEPALDRLSEAGTASASRYTSHRSVGSDVHRRSMEGACVDRFCKSVGDHSSRRRRSESEARPDDGVRMRVMGRSWEGLAVRVIAGHILMTRGRRPLNIEEALGMAPSRVQARTIKKLAEDIKNASGESCRILVLVDKAKSVESLSSLPELKRFLDTPDMAQVAVFISDIMGILSRCAPEAGEVLLAELLTYDRQVFVQLGGRPITLLELENRLKTSRFSPNVLGIGYRRMRRQALSTPEMRAKWTEPAREESARIRKQQADRLAYRLRDVRAELLEQTGRATQAEIAACATARGLRTNRGGSIRPDTVSRLLKRIDPD